MRLRQPAGRPKTTCSKCGDPLDETRVGKQRYCKKCHAEYMRTTRPTHSELSPDAKKKANTRSHTKVNLKRGAIIKEPCSVCGDVNSEAHHEDYNDSKRVNWLCRKCHMDLHEKRKNRSFWGIIYESD